MELRPYQADGIVAINESWQTKNSVLVSMPTGTGKTVLFGSLLADLLSANPKARGLILAHRDELITQACDKWNQICPTIEPGVIKGPRNEWQNRLVVASVQSLHKKRRENIPAPFDFVVIDEAHHAQSDNTYGAIVKWAKESALAASQTCKVLGVTATPYRGDAKGLGGVFESLAYSYPIVKAVQDGFLSPLEAYQIKTGVSLDDVGRNHGDLNQGQLSAVVNTKDCNELVAKAYRKYCPDDKAVAFCVDVAHALSLAATFRAQGISASAIWGAMPEHARHSTLADFAKGKIKVLTNCMVLTEGWDCPDLGAVLLVRPTMSQVVYVQQVGRVTRLAPGKESGKVLDFTWNTTEHKLVNFADLSTAQDQVARAAGPAGIGGGVKQIKIRPRGKGLRAFHVNILGQTRLSAGWYEFGNDWYASWGKTTAVLRALDPYDLDGVWRAFILSETEPREYELEIKRGDFMSVAQDTENTIVARLGNNVISRANASWKKKPASAKLIAACERWNIDVDESVTMGEASALLGYAIACANLRRMTRAKRAKQ